MDMDLNNRLTEDETLEQAYDIFLELAVDNLDPADVILFNLQFEERGGAELFDRRLTGKSTLISISTLTFLLKSLLAWPMKMAAKLTTFLPVCCYAVKKTTSSAISCGENKLFLKPIAT